LKNYKNIIYRKQMSSLFYLRVFICTDFHFTTVNYLLVGVQNLSLFPTARYALTTSPPPPTKIVNYDSVAVLFWWGTHKIY